MNTKEIINFYRADLEEYELEKNNGFLYWYKNIKKEGYHQNMSINELQYLINNIVLWYELKYPDRAFDLERGINDLRFMDVKKVLNMDIPAFLYRLPSKLVDLMNASYRSTGEGYVPLFEKGKVLPVHAISLNIYPNVPSSNEESINVIANSLTGKVYERFDMMNIIGEMQVTLGGLYNILCSQYEDIYDYHELEECLTNHAYDMELRKKLLDLAAIKMVYSINTTPEYGYKRAKKFIEEYNHDLNLDLSSDKIDAIISRDYSKNVEEKKLSVQRMIELEKYLSGDLELDDIKENDYEYLNIAKEMPMNDLLDEIYYYRKNCNWLSPVDLITYLSSEYSFDKKIIKKRIEEIRLMLKHENELAEYFCKEQRKMQKKLHKMY